MGDQLIVKVAQIKPGYAQCKKKKKKKRQKKKDALVIEKCDPFLFLQKEGMLAFHLSADKYIVGFLQFPSLEATQ